MSIGVTNVRSSQEDLSSSENAEVAVPRGLALTPGGSIVDSEMAMALSLSQQQQEEEEARKRQEEETLKRILELSLTEK